MSTLLRLAVASLLLSGCLRTSVLVEKFNSGVIETSGGDPKHRPADLRREIVQRRIKQELIDGYFGQSQRDPWVAVWLEREGAEAGAHWFSERVAEWLCSRGKTAHVSCPAPASAPAPSADLTLVPPAEPRLTAELARVVPVPTESASPLCREHELVPAAAEHFADTIRYRLALGRAVEGAAALVDEGRVSTADVEAGAKDAFAEAAAYLKRRQWRRDLKHPTVGLVVKGGATTGIFSAGAVWVALNIDRACALDPVCRGLRVSPRFEIMSGTSTGSLVATGVDMYNVSACDAQRAERLRLYESWFMCSTSKDLFCTTTGTFGELLTAHQTSLLEFDGIQQLLLAYVKPETLGNRSELLLNTVDFRTGRLDTFSDQDPSQLTQPAQVASAVMASAALPVIVKPEAHLPGEPQVPGNFTYLDGGVRSELPIAAAVRRGAERLLIVSSSQSVVGESVGQNNGMDIAVRFIEVAVGGVLESELDWAPRLAEGRRLSEFVECSTEYAAHLDSLCPDHKCDPVALCSGDWSKVCTSEPQSTGASFAALRNAPQLLAPIWRTTSIYRDESRVSGLPGYLLERSEQRKLFVAGAEEARERCFELTALLGLPATVEGDPSWRRKLLSWCSAAPTPVDSLCSVPETQAPRLCGSELPPLPTTLTATCPEPSP